LRQILGMRAEIPHGGHPEHELHAFGMPPVEMFQLREVVVATEANLAKSGTLVQRTA
jgi:hypothetical protein